MPCLLDSPSVVVLMGDTPLELIQCGSLPQLYESALTENQKLKTKLQEAQLELADVKSRLEKVAQVRGQGGSRRVRRRGDGT